MSWRRTGNEVAVMVTALAADGNNAPFVPTAYLD
jgi:hypothetical protein